MLKKEKKGFIKRLVEIDRVDINSTTVNTHRLFKATPKKGPAFV